MSREPGRWLYPVAAVREKPSHRVVLPRARCGALRTRLPRLQLPIPYFIQTPARPRQLCAIALASAPYSGWRTSLVVCVRQPWRAHESPHTPAPWRAHPRAIVHQIDGTRTNGNWSADGTPEAAESSRRQSSPHRDKRAAVSPLLLGKAHCQTTRCGALRRGCTSGVSLTHLRQLSGPHARVTQEGCSYGAADVKLQSCAVGRHATKTNSCSPLAMAPL